MRIINEQQTRRKKTKFYDDVFAFFKKNWNGVISEDSDNYGHKRINLSKSNWSFFPTVRVLVDYGDKEIRVSVKENDVGYNNLKNILKLFDNTHKGIKVELTIT